MNNQIANFGANSSTTDLLLDLNAYDRMEAIAEMMATGKTTVPKHLQGNKADCMAVVLQAMQWRMNPYAVAQKTHLVGSTLGYEAQLVNAVISSSKAIKGRFHYEYGGNWEVKGDGSAEKIQAGVNVNIGNTIDQTCWVRVGAILSGEDKIQWGEKLYPAQVTTKNSALWKTNPKQQSAYLATKYWARLYAPAVILGVYTQDELEERPKAERVINEAPAALETKSSVLNNLLSGDQEMTQKGKTLLATLNASISTKALIEASKKIKVEADSGQISEFDKAELNAAFKTLKDELKDIEAQEAALSQSEG